MTDGQQVNVTQDTAPDATTAANGGAPQAGTERTFSQSEVNSLLGDTRKEARTRAISELLAELGLEKPDDLKRVVTEHRSAEEAKLSEIEKAAKAAEKAAAERDKAMADMDALRQQFQGERIRHALEMEAGRQGFNDPADAYSLLDVSAITVDEDGTIKGVEDALKALAKAKPYLVRQGGPGRPLGTPQKASTAAASASTGATPNANRSRTLSAY